MDRREHEGNSEARTSLAVSVPESVIWKRATGRGAPTFTTFAGLRAVCTSKRTQTQTHIFGVIAIIVLFQFAGLPGISNPDEQGKSFDQSSPMPTFPSLPARNSLCHSNHTNHTLISDYCKTALSILPCQRHDAEIDKKLFRSVLGRNDSKVERDEKTDGCKMLWFAALHESDKQLCPINSSSPHSYAVDYSAALNSAIINAGDSLQPVLIVGRLGMENEDSTFHKQIGKWAEKKGAKVLYSPRLTFQDEVNRGHPNSPPRSKQGPWLRLDIPDLVERHSLFDLPNICSTHVLYTDVDVIFANEITQNDVQNLKQAARGYVAIYGREYEKNAHIMNTGVMVMNVELFKQELPLMLALARNQKKYPGHDQELLNQYRDSDPKLAKKIGLLPMHYNWKPYWRLEPSNFFQVKVIHTHGPKPGRMLDEMATCDTTWRLDGHPLKHLKNYAPLFDQGVCCDQGRTADWALNAFHNLACL